MNQAVVKYSDDILVDLENTQKMCQQLLRTPHYQKLGEVGIFAVVQKAKSIGLSPLDALNGAMYFVNGKVELVANTMNYLIRAAGHSIVKDEKSNHQLCVLRGKRIDNGDTWTASFSIEDAKKAGIYRGNWEKYPEDMLFARALSRLARQLFPDVIKGCYVEGEITEALQSEKSSSSIETISVESPKPETISNELAKELYSMLQECSDQFQEEIKMFCMKSKVAENLEELPTHLSERLSKAIIKNRNECKAVLHPEMDSQEAEA